MSDLVVGKVSPSRDFSAVPKSSRTCSSSNKITLAADDQDGDDGNNDDKYHRYWDDDDDEEEEDNITSKGLFSSTECVSAQM